MNQLEVLEIDDSSSICECCGKTNLKLVVVIRLKDGSVVRYGRDCAARILGTQFAKKVDSAIATHKNIIAAIAMINKWQYTYTVDRIANHINVSLMSCMWDGEQFVLNRDTYYQPEAYRNHVSWWVE